MNEKTYVNAIVRKIKCSGEKKKEIKRQLLADIEMRMKQGNRHMAVGEVTVTYENVSVTYRLSYDEDMCLAGIYVR